MGFAHGIPSSHAKRAALSCGILEALTSERNELLRRFEEEDHYAAAGIGFLKETFSTATFSAPLASVRIW
jgi:hypothetical protein